MERVGRSNQKIRLNNDFEPYGVELPPFYQSESKLLYTGQERDYYTNYDYMHARFYGSSTGRFLRPDPVNGNPANPQSWNLYVYVKDNPVNGKDPTGMLLIPLGQHTDEQFKEVLANIKQQLKNNNLTEKQKAELKEQKKILQLERQGNKIVRDMLANLDKVGERKGLTVQDFTLTTDYRKDFADFPEESLKEISKKDAFVLSNHPIFKGTIYIRTDNANGFYQLSQMSRDWQYYGATALGHEGVHLKGEPSEFFAYSYQLEVLNEFKKFFSSIELYKHFDQILKKNAKKAEDAEN